MYKIKFYKSDIIIIVSFLLMILTYFYALAQICWFMFGCFSIALVFSWKAPKELIYIQLFFVLQFQHYVSSQILPNTVSYFTDVVTLIIFLHLVREVPKNRFNKLEKVIIFSSILFIFLGFMSNYYNNFDILKYAWAVRNNIRIFIFFVASSYFIDFSMVNKTNRLLKIAFTFNTIMVLIQFFTLPFAADFIGGIFGHSVGVANTYIHILLLYFLCYSLVNYLNRQISVITLLYYLIPIFLISAVAELKILYVEAVILFIIISLFSKKSIQSVFKFLLIGIMLLVGTIVTLPILVQISPFFKDFFNIENILKIAGGSYTGQDDISRLKAISYVQTRFFHNDVIKNWIGIGLGNAEQSQFSFLQSPLFLQYERTRYNWFTLPFVMVETGLIGVVIFIYPYIYALIELILKVKKEPSTIIAIALLSTVPLLYIYNLTLRTEIGYLFVYLIASHLPKSSKVSN